MSETLDLAQKLSSEGAKYAEFFASLNDAEWQTEVYTEGAVWTIRNILAHLMTAERGFIRLFTGILEGGSGASEDFSIDRYNARQQEKTRDMNPAELLEAYRQVRSEMVTFVAGLQDPVLEKMGRHPFLGWTSLREMIKMVYLHNQIHYRDLRRVLR
ncbi:MAG: DinB family protein [Bacteroidota bacterium]